MTPPTVSVIIPTFNREALLPRALDSVIEQSFTNWEIVLVDDGSTDATRDLARRYRKRLGDRFQYLYRANTGCGGARNCGIDAARGEFVAFLDSDDEYLPTKLERQMELFQRCPELGFVYSDFSYQDTEGVHHPSNFDSLGRLAREVKSETVSPRLRVCSGDLFDVLLRGYFIATIVGVVRRDVLGDTIRWSPDPSYSAEWLFFLKVAKACPAGFVDEALCLHHFVSGSVTRTSKNRNFVRLRKLLQEMAETLTDLSRSQRGVLRRHRVRNVRQLGYDAFKAGDLRKAMTYLAEATRMAPGPGTVWDLLHVGFRWMTTRRGRSGGLSSALDP